MLIMQMGVLKKVNSKVLPACPVLLGCQIPSLRIPVCLLIRLFGGEDKMLPGNVKLKTMNIE